MQQPKMMPGVICVQLNWTQWNKEYDTGLFVDDYKLQNPLTQTVSNDALPGMVEGEK